MIPKKNIHSKHRMFVFVLSFSLLKAEVVILIYFLIIMQKDINSVYEEILNLCLRDTVISSKYEGFKSDVTKSR